MSLTIQTKKESKCKKYKFCIYHHELSLADLDVYILQIMFDETKLNQLFQPNSTLNIDDRINQLRRFIETKFINREKDVTVQEIEKAISENENNSYYSFFAEALLARLNIDWIDDKLITGVILVDDTIKTVSTGADVCMYSDENLVLGEAKFYNNLGGGLDSIITDKSFESKLESFINKLSKQKNSFFLKNIDGIINKKTQDEIKALPLIFTGFVLHTKSIKNNYDTHYEKVDAININNFEKHYQAHLYHLPIESKEELIFKAQKKALDLIIELEKLIK